MDYLVISVAGALPNIENKSVRALAVFDSERAEELPDVPTTVELGQKDLVISQWFGLLAPAGTADDIRATLESQVLKVVRSPEVAKQLVALGVTGAQNAAYLERLMEAEFKRWPALMPNLGIHKK